MEPHFQELAARLPPVVHALLIERVDPSSVDLGDLIAALGGGASAAPALRSLRLLRVAQGLPPEPPIASIDESRLLRRPRVLRAEACAALRAAVDAYAAADRGSAEPRSAPDGPRASAEVADHLFSRPFSTSLTLSRTQLVGIVGRRAARSLWSLRAELLSGVNGELGDDGHDDCVGADAEDGDFGPNPDDVEISVRRYTPKLRPWIPFHNDRAAVTVNVALAPDQAHAGGHLVVVYSGKAHRLLREEGEATVHPPELLHAVSRMEEGVRYSLILFFNPRK
jgi:hypothetical protein